MTESATYRLFHEAMASRKQVVCVYDGHLRELCPIILGHSDGAEKALVYQFGGTSSGGPGKAKAWKCLTLAKVRDARLRDGAWHGGPRQHGTAQSCVRKVDVDVNPDSPYRPKRQLPTFRD